MESALELPFAVQIERVGREEDLAHPRELDPRPDVVQLLGPLAEIDNPGHIAHRAVGDELHTVEHHLRALELEGADRPCGHRYVVLDGDGAVGEPQDAAIVGRLGQGDVDVARDRTPVGAEVAVDELAPIDAEVLQRGHDRVGPGPRGPRRAGDPGERLAAVRERLDHHAPVAHLDGVEEDFAMEKGTPGEGHLDVLGDEPGILARAHAVDDQVLEDEPASPELDAETPDAHLALEPVAPGSLGAGLQRRTEVDADDAHQHDGEGDREHHHDRARGAINRGDQPLHGSTPQAPAGHPPRPTDPRRRAPPSPVPRAQRAARSPSSSPR